MELSKNWFRLQVFYGRHIFHRDLLVVGRLDFNPLPLMPAARPFLGRQLQDAVCTTLLQFLAAPNSMSACYARLLCTVSVDMKIQGRPLVYRNSVMNFLAHSVTSFTSQPVPRNLAAIMGARELWLVECSMAQCAYRPWRFNAKSVSVLAVTVWRTSSCSCIPP